MLNLFVCFQKLFSFLFLMQMFAVYYLHCKDMGIKIPLQLIIPNRCRGYS